MFESLIIHIIEIKTSIQI